MVYFNEASEKLCFVAKFCDCSRIKGFPMPQHMFSWRSQRRIGAILVVFTFFGIFGAVSYWRFKALPTCSDNIKNQDELAVDCGGSCGSCELKNPKDVSVIWARAVPVTNTVVDVAAFVKNMNEILASPSLEYRFTLSDETGVVAERVGKTYLYPQERTYIVEANIPVARTPTRVEFLIVRSEWQLYEESPSNITVQGTVHKLEQETASTSRSVVETQLFNDSPFDFRTVDVSFLLFDKNENLIGVNKTIVERFLTRTDREARTVWPEVIEGGVVSVIVEPRVNAFSPTWLLRPE